MAFTPYTNQKPKVNGSTWDKPKLATKGNVFAKGAGTTYTEKDPKVSGTTWEKQNPMAKGGDLTKAPGQVTGATQRRPAVTTTPKVQTPTVDIGAGRTPTVGMAAPPSYDSAISMYRDLAGAKDPLSLKKRRDLANWIKNNKPGATATGGATGAGAAVGEAVAGAGTTSTFNPADYEGDLAAPEMAESGSPLIDPAMWQQMLANLSKSGEWASNVRLPTEQELADLYAKNYEQQLADLSYGVQGKQTQAQKQREQYLADRGISPDSAAYRNEQQSLAEQRAFEDAQLRTQARGFAQQQAESQFNRAYQTSAAEMEKARLEQDLKYRGLEALTPLATTEAQLRGQKDLAQYNAKTQVLIEGARLDQSDRQFLSSMAQDDRQFIETIAQQEADRAQNKEQFNTNFKQRVKEFKTEVNLRKKEFYEAVRSAKVLEDNDRKKLAELIRSNKRGEALQLLAIKKQGAGGKEAEDLDALANRIRTIGAANLEVLQKYKKAGFGPEQLAGGYDVSLG